MTATPATGHQPPLTVQRIATDLCRSILTQHPDWPLALKLPGSLWPLRHERTPACPQFDPDGTRPAGPCIVLSPGQYAVFLPVFTGSEWLQEDPDWQMPYPDRFEAFRIYPQGTVLGEGFRAVVVARVRRRLALIGAHRAWLFWGEDGTLADVAEYPEPVTAQHAQARYAADGDMPAAEPEPVAHETLPAIRALIQQTAGTGRHITRDDLKEIQP